MPNLPTTARAKIVNRVGLGGICTFDDPKDINDIELANGRNIVFDNGIVGPRKGSLLHRAKPTGETAEPFQMLVATDSNGLDYLIVNYGVNFYLDDTTNNQWVKLNQAYSPVLIDLFYGFTSWNNGTVDDRFYFCNGKEDVMKWIMGVSTLSVAALAADTTITLVDSTTFPASGTILIQNGLTAFTLTYTANNTTTGVLTLAGVVGQNVPIGSTVTIPIVNVPAIPIGKILVQSQGRLFTMNGLGNENTYHFSYSADPENYTVDGSASTAGSATVTLGKGGIVNATDFGQYLLIEKENVLCRLDFNFTADQTAFIDQLTPVINGDGIGPAETPTILNYMNTLYYPTSAEGIVSFSPNTTGNQSSSGLQVLSQKINNIVTGVLDFSLSRTAGLGQKLYWLCARPTIGVPVNTNNLLLVYDLVRAAQNPTLSAWSIFDNWVAVDIKPVNEILYYLSKNDGAVYQCYVSYQDAQNDTPVGYNSIALTKRFNLDSPELLMRPVYMYVEGYITLTTKLYCTIFDNENGLLGTQSYEIFGSNPTITGISLGGGMGFFPMAIPFLGGVDLATMQSLQAPQFFRVYLELAQAFRPHNIQAEFFSVDIGSQWGISSIVLITVPEPSIETKLVMGPSTVPTLPTL